MAYLVDTSVLVRLANRADARYVVAAAAVLELHRRGESLLVTPQVLIEFRSAATRPAAANGLGLPAAEAESQAAEFEATFAMAPDTPDIYQAWKTLVTAAGVIGKQVHDARLAAVCQVHGFSHLLTFNVSHFARLSRPGRGPQIVDPADV